MHKKWPQLQPPQGLLFLTNKSVGSFASQPTPGTREGFCCQQDDSNAGFANEAATSTHGYTSACRGASFTQHSIGLSFMKRRAGFMHTVNKLIISHVFLCRGDVFCLRQPALTKTAYKRSVCKPWLQPPVNNDRVPLFKVKSWPELYFVPSVPVRKKKMLVV